MARHDSKGEPARGPLRSMSVSAGFREFVLDQLAGMAGLQARRMFGAVGLYAGDLFFGIVAADVLFFKVDDVTRHEYEAAGSSPFTPYPNQTMTMGYYSVPVAVLEEAVELRRWARRAVAVARRAATAKARGAQRRTKPAKTRARA